jgi:hypothetical protein
VTDTDAVAGLIVDAWSRIACDTSELDDDAPWLRDPGGRDWLQVRLVEWHRADSGAAVVHLLQQSLPLPAAGLCVRDRTEKAIKCEWLLPWSSGFQWPLIASLKPRRPTTGTSHISN